MKNKTVILILSILAVAMYTTAVINFCLGDVLGGIAGVLIACSDIIIVWTLKRQELYAKALVVIGNSHCDLLKALLKGVPARLTIKKSDDDDDKGDVIPEEKLTEDEKRVKRMAEEYDQLAGRYERLTNFLGTDTFKQLSREKKDLLERQHVAMGDYKDTLQQRIQLECDKGQGTK